MSIDEVVTVPGGLEMVRTVLWDKVVILGSETVMKSSDRDIFSDLKDQKIFYRWRQ